MARSPRSLENGRALKNIQFCSNSRKTKILTTGIHLVFRGLKFKSDTEIGQKGMFFKALNRDDFDHGLGLHPVSGNVSRPLRPEHHAVQGFARVHRDL